MGAQAEQVLRDIYERLWKAYGRQHWWPADTTTEVVVGAILTQNTAWKNVERAIANLKDARCMSWKALRDLPDKKLADCIRPAGTYRVKARRLKAFVGRLWEEHSGSLRRMLAGDLEDARRRLVAIPGIGPETADAILLYAGGRSTFVVDTYTRRVLRRHFVIDASCGYETIRGLFQRAMVPDAQIYNEYHALLVAVGKEHCRAEARCEGCPLVSMPHDGQF